jgi:hypothetical protein
MCNTCSVYVVPLQKISLLQYKYRSEEGAHVFIKCKEVNLVWGKNMDWSMFDINDSLDIC